MLPIGHLLVIYKGFLAIKLICSFTLLGDIIYIKKKPRKKKKVKTNKHLSAAYILNY